ncbi:zf-HC2 domain-containing protein [Psychrobacillus sp. MER TA 171]|uniref:zf-HC2 domain-containing protein n=1 Tax=Psychrobacillus sp. MER TA 171 TaxID=2939577 RepID=UPI00204012AA|nr:zf-HC2 domain-containing protein [Psychrobacillus sp. MER TA 171]MCM3359378.1 zf-HC2 domain-containing protein [Psychrobacillus sp. MER TA 171]
MNCNIIKDLLPSYIDGICSEETVTTVEKHIEHCQRCKDTLQMMKQPTVQIDETNVEAAKEPFKRINKKRRFQVITAIVLSFMICIIASLVVQDVGVVNQFFFPKSMGIAEVTDDREEWQSVSFSSDLINLQDYVIYDSLFWKKEIINSAYNESDVLLRVKDEKGDVIIDEILIPHGKSVKLDGLKRKEKYFFEIKAPQGRYNINAV